MLAPSMKTSSKEPKPLRMLTSNNHFPSKRK